MKIGRPVAFVVLAFMIGAIISQGSFAFADDSATNPFRAIWEAIGELQTRTDSLQAQIDDIKTNGVEASEEQLDAKVSETSLAIDIGGGDAGQTVISVVATNTGPESAVGVKVLTYYQMSLLDVYFIDGAQCTDQARGIIECYVGTIESGGAAQITIDATPLQLGEQAIITADVSSITEDSDPANNHAEAVFITSEAPVVLPPQEEEEEPVEEQPASSGGSSEQPSEQGSEAPAEQPGEETPSEQPAENEQGSEEQAGEQTGQEGSEEQSSGEESSESGEQSSEGGEQSGSEGGESSGDAGSSEGSAGEGSSDSGSDSGSSDSGDSGSGDSSSGDSGSSDSGGDSGSEGSSSDGGSSDGGSDGGSDSGGDSGGDSGSSGGESTG